MQENLPSMLFWIETLRGFSTAARITQLPASVLIGRVLDRIRNEGQQLSPEIAQSISAIGRLEASATELAEILDAEADSLVEQVELCFNAKEDSETFS